MKRKATTHGQKWLRRLTPWVGLLLLLVGLRLWQTRGTASGPAPHLTAQALDGKVISLETLRAEPVLVHFWSSWCGVCKLMDDSVAALADEHAVVTVASWSGGAEALRAHMRERDLAMPVVADPDGHHARTFGVTAVPTTFVIDTSGRIRHVEVGYTTELGLRARLWLASSGAEP